jgi:hypothetical protein
LDGGKAVDEGIGLEEDDLPDNEDSKRELKLVAR